MRKRGLLAVWSELLVAVVKVSVCIPTFNDADVLGRAVLSVIAQTVPPLEIIIVDDGSDKPVTFNDQGLRMTRVVRVTNRGLPAARNTGLMLAKGEAIIFLDADDTIREDFIEKTLPLLTPDVDVVLVGLQEIGPTRNGRYNAGFDRPWDQVTVDLLIHDYNRFFYCCLARCSVLRQVGGYHPAMAGWPGVNGGYEDWDLWITLMRHGARFAAVDEPLLLYTTKPDSMLTRAEQNREALVSEMHRHHRV